MNYSLNQLRIFLKVVETRSITKAAESLHLTQPAVSIQLKKFQDQFDIALTEVVNKKLYVTDFGNEIALLAEKILDQVYAINYKTLAYKGMLTGRLIFSTVSTGKYIAPYLIANFLKQHQGVELKLDVTNKAEVIHDLENNKVDFSLVSVVPEHLKLNKIPLFENKLVLVANKELAIASPKAETIDFSNLPLIFREPGSGTRQIMEKYLHVQNIRLSPKMELTSNEAVKQAVLAGLGYAVMPLIGIKKEVKQGELKIIPVQGFPLKSIWHIVWQKNKNLNPVAQAFMDYLTNKKNEIVRNHFQELPVNT